MAINNSFPAFHTTGAVHNYVRVGGFNGATGNPGTRPTPLGEIWYLGTCETQPVLSIDRKSVPIFNDVGGRSIPVQKTYDGEVGTIGLMLSRFSQAAYGVLQAPSATTEPEIGKETFLSRGSLLYGKRTFELWQWFSFFGSDAATPGMQCGFYWPQVELVKHNPEKWGTEGQVLLIQGEATPRFFPKNVSLPSRWITRSQNLADFPTEVRGEQ